MKWAYKLHTQQGRTKCAYEYIYGLPANITRTNLMGWDSALLALHWRLAPLRTVIQYTLWFCVYVCVCIHVPSAAAAAATDRKPPVVDQKPQDFGAPLWLILSIRQEIEFWCFYSTANKNLKSFKFDISGFSLQLVFQSEHEIQWCEQPVKYCPKIWWWWCYHFYIFLGTECG